jgi:outer membrane receptor protein involved in Fe transport
LINVGKLKGTGIEANLNFTPIKNQDLRWDIGVSYTSNKTVVTKLTDDAKSVRLAGNSFMGVYADEGQELSVIKGIVYERDPEGRIVVDASTGLPNITSTQEI